MSKYTALETSMKACNDTAGSNGLVLALILFVVMTQITLVPTEILAQVEKMLAMEVPWK